MTWTTDKSGSIDYCTVFLENDCSPQEATSFWKPSAQLRSTTSHRLAFRLPMEGSKEDWQDKPGRHWRGSAGMWAQAGRQKDRARILKCTSIVFQDILSSPLRNGTAGKACSRLWRGGWKNDAMRCQMISPQKASNSLWFDSFLPLSVREASESKLNVLQHANAQRCQQMDGVGHGRVGSPLRPSALLPSHYQFETVKYSFALTSKNSYFHLPPHLHCCEFISNVSVHSFAAYPLKLLDWHVLRLLVFFNTSRPAYNLHFAAFLLTKTCEVGISCRRHGGDWGGG